MKTLKFIFKSIYQNIVILEEEQKWWLAIIIFLVSLVASIGGTMYTGFTSNANGLLSTSSDTGSDIGWSEFSQDIDKAKTLYIENGKLVIGSDFSAKDKVLNVTTSTYDSFNSTAHDATFSYTHYNSDKEVAVYKVYVITGLDPIGSSADSTFITNFVKESIYLYNTDESANKWTPYSYMIITDTYVRAASYKIVGAASTDSAVADFSGSFTDITSFDFYSVGHDTTSGSLLTSTEVNANMLSFINNSYTTIRNKSTWIYVGIYSAMNAGVMILAGLIFWLISRSKGSIVHYTFWQSEKIMAFMSLTPALITFVISFFMSAYASFIFLMIIALRVMNAVQRLSGNKPTDDKPVYKARS